jgi:hypothetical protein
MAAANGHVDCVRILMDGGSNAALLTPSGVTAALLAAKHGHESILRMLQAAGASLDHPTVVCICAWTGWARFLIGFDVCVYSMVSRRC